MIKRAKGTYDVLPEEIEGWHYLENKFRGILESYGYKEIRTPLLEETALFTGSIGAGTDIVEKEMFTFKSREHSLSLRPEATASVVRAYLEHKLNPGATTRLYYMGEMFRRERPQKGRFRQFRQTGIEAIGSAAASLDVEVISLCLYLIQSLGLKDLELLLNSLGCRNCRCAYYEKLRQYFQDKTAGLCVDCQRRLQKNPLRIFDCKKETCQTFLKNAPTIDKYLCADCARHFQEVKKYLDLLKISYKVSPYLVRGLDYYRRTAFELIYKKFDSPQQNALAAGGRYDQLIEDLGGPSTPAIGFAMGMERILASLKIAKLNLSSAQKRQFYFVLIGKEAFIQGFKMTEDLRKKGFILHRGEEDKSLKSQLRQADHLKADYALILGEEELNRHKIVLRDMQQSSQYEISLDNLEREMEHLTDK